MQEQVYISETRFYFFKYLKERYIYFMPELVESRLKSSHNSIIIALEKKY